MAQDSHHNRSKINDSTDSDTGPSLGSYLQRERIKKEFTLEEVAEQTCINIGTLRAIESNDRSKMPAEVFSRGFIKLYAKFLSLDPQEVLDRYEREMAHGEEENIRNHDVFQSEIMAESSYFFNLRKIFILIILLVLIALGCYFFFYSDSPSYRRSSYSLGSGNKSLSSQINEKFESAQPPAQTQYPPTTATGGTYSAPTAPATGQPVPDSAGYQGQGETSYNPGIEQVAPQAESPDAGDLSSTNAPINSVDGQESPSPAQ